MEQEIGLQICNRCRKKKIRCDMQLPSCKNCRLADSECLFWDDSLEQDVPCSYLHALRQRVSGLQLEIQEARHNTISLSTHRDATATSPSPGHGYYVAITSEANLRTSPEVEYLGPGNCAILLEKVIKAITQLLLGQNRRIPERLLTDEPRTGRYQDISPTELFPTLQDQRKPELHNILPPSTQRALIEHYTNVVSPEYRLLPPGQEAALLALENPARWSSSNKDDSRACGISIIFAISTALVARDLDSNLSGASIRCREELVTFSENFLYEGDVVEDTKWRCRALSAMVLLETINPASGQLWELLGRATSTLKQLHEGYQLARPDLDDEFRDIEKSILKLDGTVELHFGRLSPFHDSRLYCSGMNVSSPDILSEQLEVLGYRRSIIHTFLTSPNPSAELMERLIPPPLRVDLVKSDMGIASAALLVACSASRLIDHYSHLNDGNKIISVWMTAESTLQSGAIWATYLLHRHSTVGRGADMETRLALGPILKVTRLLSSFAARWKPGHEFEYAWEILVELLLELLG
ncbi:hypothetical protein GQ53DRAFT_641221 [Thozetella sp. PMI_491]|nr:hypothetical protein GQ53DRAFT_641221 [Thozetella sp. PMI_491]